MVQCPMPATRSHHGMGRAVGVALALLLGGTLSAGAAPHGRHRCDGTRPAPLATTQVIRIVAVVNGDRDQQRRRGQPRPAVRDVHRPAGVAGRRWIG